VSLGIPFHLKKKLGVVASFREQIYKNHMRQNVGKEKQKSTCFGIFYKNHLEVQVMNFIPVKVSTLYGFPLTNFWFNEKYEDIGKSVGATINSTRYFPNLKTLQIVVDKTGDRECSQSNLMKYNLPFRRHVEYTKWTLQS
jgi:hypothetical protein